MDAIDVLRTKRDGGQLTPEQIRWIIGAYTVGILTTRLGWSFWLAWPAAALIAGAFGILLALPALRVRGPYLAMITIAFSFIIQHAIVEMRGLTGGQVRAEWREDLGHLREPFEQPRQLRRRSGL